MNKRLLAFLSDPDSVPSRPPPVLAVRPATAADVPAIAAIDSTFPTRRVLLLDRRGLAPSLTFDFSLKEREADTTHANAEPAAYWHQHLRDEDTVLVATRDGVVAGAVVLQEWDFNRTLWVADIRVQPLARRHGIGRALMDAAVEQARMRGLVSLRLETQSDNIDAVQFYLKYGFRFSGFDDRLYLNQHPDPERENRIALFFTFPVTNG